MIEREVTGKRMDGWILILCFLLVAELGTNLFYCPMSLFSIKWAKMLDISWGGND